VRWLEYDKICKNRGFQVFQNGGLVGAFCKIEVSGTGSLVHFLGFFGVLGHFRGIRGWYNIIWGFVGLVILWSCGGCNVGVYGVCRLLDI